MVVFVASAVVLFLAGALLLVMSLPLLLLLLVDLRRGLPFLGKALLGMLLPVLGMKLLAWGTGGGD